MMLSLIILGGIVSYIAMAVGAFTFLEVALDWRENSDEIFICSIGWPIFILFWMIIGGPACGIYWVCKRATKLLRRAARKTYTSEVK